jgi:hypothetical protein
MPTAMRRSVFAALALSHLLPLFLPQAHALLPLLKDPNWLEYHGVYDDQKFRFDINSKGEMHITPKRGSTGEPVSWRLALKLDYGIEETRADGSKLLRRIERDSIAATERPSNAFVKTTLRGITQGGAAFELDVVQESGVISLGGRITDYGNLDPAKALLVIRVRVPDVHSDSGSSGSDKDKDDDEKERDRGDERDERRKQREREERFEKKIDDDRLDLVRIDGTKLKLDFVEPLEVAAPALNAGGFQSAEFRIATYTDRRFRLHALPGSALTLWNARSAPLHEGFTVEWRDDASKDSSGAARLQFEVR